MRKTYSVKGLAALAWKRKWFIVIAVLLVGLASFLITKFTIPLKYSSDISMFVNNFDNVDQAENQAYYSDVQVRRALAQTYIEMLKSRAVMEEIGERLIAEAAINEQLGEETVGEGYFNLAQVKAAFPVHEGIVSVGALNSCFSLSVKNETEVLMVSVTTTDPEISEAVCRLMGEVAPEFLPKFLGFGSVQLIDTAVANYAPVSPNLTRNVLLGALIGLALALLVIFLIDLFDNTVKETEGLEEEFNKAILGEIYGFEGDKKEKKLHLKLWKNPEEESRSIHLIDTNTPFVTTESYKTMRNNVLFALGTFEHKVLAVSSPNALDGKSTVAANLALTLAEAGRKVLLIDADMRKPRQHKFFKAKNTEGLSTLIIGRTTEEKTLRKQVRENLDLLTAGPTPPNPSELLASAQFASLMERLNAQYEYIIIDTPPVNVVSDAIVFSKLVSGIMLVLRYARTTYNDIVEAIRQAELANANLLGFVLNDVEYSYGSSYHYKNYKSHYRDYSYKYTDHTPEATQGGDKT